VKTCRKCGEEKPHSAFNKHNDALQPRCKQCEAVYYQENKAHISARNAAYRKAHPQSQRNWRSWRHGLTVEQYDVLMKDHEGVCAVCKQPEPQNKALSIDHNHLTGKVRGLLCHPCNAALGLLKEDSARIDRLMKYIEKYEGVNHAL